MTAIPFYESIDLRGYLDLNKNELRNAVLQVLGSAPGSPNEAQMYYNSGDDSPYFRNGSAAWVSMNPASLLALANTWTNSNIFNGAITGNDDINLTGVGSSSVGGTFSATQYLASGQTGAAVATKYAGGTASGAPGSGSFTTGDWIVTTGGDIWICTAGGTPGTWSRVGSYLLGTANTWTQNQTINASILGNGVITLTGVGASSVGGTFSATQHIATGQTGATTSTKYAGGTASGAPGSGTFTAGDWIVTTGGDLYVCTSGGTPGTWSRVGSYLLGANNTWSGTNAFNNAITGSGTINLTGTGTGSVGGTFTATALIASGLTGATQASRYVGATTSGAPASGTFAVGDFSIARDGAIWVCTGAGTPGTWVQIGAVGTVYYQTIKNNAGTGQTQRANLKFINGTYVTPTVADATPDTTVLFDVAIGTPIAVAFSGSNSNGSGTALALANHQHQGPTHNGAAHSGVTINDLGTPTADFSMGSHKITSLTDGTAASDAATWGQVQAIVQGLDWKDAVRVVATTNAALATAYENGDTVDGVVLATGDRILLAGQTTASERGIYTVNASGAPTRATDADASGEISVGVVVPVREGSTDNANSFWYCTATTATPWVPGSSGSTWSYMFKITATQAGAGLTASGNVLAVGAGTGITVNADDVAINTSVVARKVIFGTGPGSTGTSWVLNHNLANRDVQVSVYDATTYAEVFCDKVRTDTNNVTLNFASNVTLNTLRAVVIG